MLTACAQSVPAPVVNGYQRDNEVPGTNPQAAASSRFSLTRDVTAKTETPQNSAQMASAPAVQEEELSKVEPAAGPAGKAASDGSFVDDWSGKTAQNQGVVTHTVQPGETVYRLARRYNTTPAEILKQNQLSSTADLRPGQQLTIAAGSRTGPASPAAQVAQSAAPVAQPRSAAAAAPVQVAAKGSAPMTPPPTTPMTARLLPPASLAEPAQQSQQAARTDAEVATIEPAAGPKKEPAKEAPKADTAVKVITHKVQPGETVYRIAHQYGASVLDVMSANNFEKPQELKSGMVVKVPVEGQATAGAKSGGKTVSREEDDTAVAKPVPAKTAVDEVKAAFNKGKIDPVAARAKGLAWPVHGQLIRKFGNMGGGIAHAGINIAVPPNTPVLAADDGTVLYAGSGLKTYGNLVLIRHESGMVSAYAHNNQLLVEKGELVKKGQVIALSGATGNVDKPQVHFELRREARAIDPMSLLASQ